VTLWCDPKAVYGGREVGGIRISHLSVLKAPRKFNVTERRGKTKEVTIHPIAPEKKESTSPPNAEEQEYITVATGELETVTTLGQLQAHGQLLANKSKPIQDALRPVYTKRKKELEA
jgi:hypothetical protein